MSQHGTTLELRMASTYIKQTQLFKFQKDIFTLPLLRNFNKNKVSIPTKASCIKSSAGLGSVSFWASRIRIRHYLYGSGSGSLHKEKSKKNLDFYCFVISLRLFML
jgi:hypothetical protein